jgi:hypothetical protein
MSNVLEVHTDLIGVETSAELSRVDPGATRITLLRRPGCSSTCWSSRAKERTGSARRTDTGLEICTHCIHRDEAAYAEKRSSCDCQLAICNRRKIQSLSPIGGPNEANRR